MLPTMDDRRHAWGSRPGREACTSRLREVAVAVLLLPYGDCVPGADCPVDAVDPPELAEPSDAETTHEPGDEVGLTGEASGIDELVGPTNAAGAAVAHAPADR